MNRRTALALGSIAAAVATTTAVSAQDTTHARVMPPAPGPLRPYQFPRVERFALANGVSIVVLERHTIPLVSARIFVDAGALREPPASSGLASLVGSLLGTGTRALTGAQFAERMESYGAAFSTDADHLQAGASVTAPSPAFADAFALAATTVTQPSFLAGEFRRLQSEALANIQQRRASVEGLASEVFARAVFDSASAYARPPEGTPATVGRLTQADVVRWYQEAYGPRATTVVLVGDITPAAARQAVERALGSWQAPGGARSTPTLPRPSSRVAGVRSEHARVILVDRAGSVQSGIALGQVAIAATDPDYLPLITVNRVLGEGFSSRLNMNLRERHGFTYSASSELQARRWSGAIVAISSVRTNATDSALVEAVAEWRRIGRDTIPPAEFQRGVNSLVASFPTSVQTVQNLCDRVAMAIATGLPADYYASYRERLATVTAADAHAAAVRVLRPDTPTVVVVGDLRMLESRVRALNLGSVEVWDVEGQRVR